MRTTGIIFGVISAIQIFLTAADSFSQTFSRKEVTAALAVETQSIRPGEPFWAGVRLTMSPGWHVNWVNPGDAGLAPIVEWSLPEGFEAGDIAWPYPERYDLPGLSIFGYEGDVLLVTRISPPETLRPGETVSLEASVTWLACREACVPGDAELSFEIPVADEPPQADPQWADDFARTRRLIPRETPGWRFGARAEADHIIITARPAAGTDAAPEDVRFFPFDQGVIENTSSQAWARSGDAWTLTLARAPMGGALPERLGGVLVARTPWDDRGLRAVRFEVPVSNPSR